MSELANGLTAPRTLPAADAGPAAPRPESAAAGAAALAGRLAGWADPEWLPFAAFLLAPALALFALGQPQRASFFAGLAVYLAVLKWLGWVVLSRCCPRPTAFLLFPAEVLTGLAVLSVWFYLRNLVSLWWPASYSLHELAALPILIAALHLLAGAWRLRGPVPPGPGKAAALGRGLLARAAVYGPFLLSLLIALWTVSGVLHVQTTDPIHNGTTAEVYLTHGIFYPHINGGTPIIYPAAFGAFNALAAAVAPLALVQVLNLQHVVLLVTGAFLLTSTVAVRSGRPLWFLHSLWLAFLSIFPLYSLYPFLCYEGPGRQAAPALVAALCLLPVLATVRRPAGFYRLAAVEAVLALLVLALNPVCATFVVPAGLVAAAGATAAGRRLGLSWPRVLGAQALALAVRLPAVCAVHVVGAVGRLDVLLPPALADPPRGLRPAAGGAGGQPVPPDRRGPAARGRLMHPINGRWDEVLIFVYERETFVKEN
jgi:hypothetical protein